MELHAAKELPQCPEYFNFAYDVVDKWAAQLPSLQAMLWVDQQGKDPQSLDFAHFSRQSNRAAELLVRLGARRGDRLIIVLPRVPAWWEIATAAIRIGIVVCPCTVLAVAHDIKYRAEASKASIFVGDTVSISKFKAIQHECPDIRTILQAAGSPLVDELQYSAELEKIPKHFVFKDTLPKTKWSDPSVIYFTSGTTGMPKMVLHNQVSYPLGWAKAAWAWFAAWSCGAALFVQETVGPFNAESALDNLHNYPITTLCSPPTAYRQFVLPSRRKYFSQRPPLALEQCVGAGEPLNDEVIRIWEDMSGIKIRDGYGQTETTLVCGNLKGAKVKYGSMGLPVPGVPLTVVDEKGDESPSFQEGEIAIATTTSSGVRTINIFSGYLSPDGKVTLPQRKWKSCYWYLTGDRAYKDEDGYLWFVGRSDDVINSSGYRIGESRVPAARLVWNNNGDIDILSGPFEVESVLKKHPAVVESAVVASPDPDRVEVVKAFIVLQDSFKSRNPDSLVTELQEFCKKQTAPYKYPRRIQFVEPSFLPKTISGKIKRAELRALERRVITRGARI
ncbi:acetyl-coenzyme A synthetase [Histoplasma capsulatum G186AR]|uniref:medium-chain acyl-CoA ligase n=1 Tax=Ajellomyces capsulatus (strain G186AR / H82 / ATCC MYA-2454 / RMSCC 2432) TaxID=447093 RepID=C0NHC5_AJECG|nr:acetyl-coenzyme A synthetase [Histoplasma capsulatum G186AR]EEH09210.1 acetyl-coenzyme A synthetase [Histoplasma capsulatum G186AR]